METYCLSQAGSAHRFKYGAAILQILLRICQTLPDLVFASALGILVIFCANIAFAAMPPLTPESAAGSVHGGGDDAGTVGDSITSDRESLLAEGKGQAGVEGDDGTTKKKIEIARSLSVGVT